MERSFSLTLHYTLREICLPDSNCYGSAELDATCGAAALIGWLYDGRWAFLYGDGTGVGVWKYDIEALGEDLRCGTSAHLALGSHGRNLGRDGGGWETVDAAGWSSLEADFACRLNAGIRTILSAEMLDDLDQIHLCARCFYGVDDMGLYHRKCKI